MNTSHQEVIGMQASPPIDKETLRAELKHELRSDFLQDIRIESGIDSSGEEAVAPELLEEIYGGPQTLLSHDEHGGSH